MTRKRDQASLEGSPKGPSTQLASKACSHIVFWHGIPDREDDQMNPRRLIARANSRILISGITLTFIVKDCADALERALERGVEIDLIIAEDNENSHRWYENYSSEVSARLRVGHALARRLLNRLPGELANRIRIHLTSVPMTHSIGWYDNRIFVSEFCLWKDAAAVPSYCIPEECDSYGVFAREILHLIETARPLPIVRLLTIDCWDTLLANNPAWDDAIRRRIAGWLHARSAVRNMPDRRGAVASCEERAPLGLTASRPLQILAVATEWESRHGGLSTLNRNLCLALRAAGHRVVCCVPDATDFEIAGAWTSGVELRRARPSCGASARELLMRRPSLPDDFWPDVVIGHGSHTGPAASAWVEDYFSSSLRVHFVHTAPGEIEIFKAPPDGTTASAKADRKEYEERTLAEDAGVVVAVGPRLGAEIATQLAADPHPPVIHILTPGLDASNSDRPPSLPPNIHCLFLGRAEDLELKGLDIAARAMTMVAAKWMGPGQLVLVVRGAPPGTGDALHEQLVKTTGIARNLLRVREYTPNLARLREELRQSSLVLMPSRSEGFGLVGLEAISAGVPILVSSESGLGQSLVQTLGKTETSRFVIPVVDEVETDARVWAEEIRFNIRDRRTSFRLAAELRESLSGMWSWNAAIAGFVAEIERKRMEMAPGQNARPGAYPLSSASASVHEVGIGEYWSRLDDVFAQEAEWFRRLMQENTPIAEPSLARVRFILDRLAISADQAELEELHASIQTAINDPAPVPVDGARTFLERVRGRGLQTCLVSNTGWFSGPTVRRALDASGLGQWLGHMVFADEVGSGKPGREIFERAISQAACAAGDALHVGDDPSTDIAGAIAYGMSAIHLARAGDPGDGRCPSFTSYQAVWEYLKAAGILA